MDSNPQEMTVENNPQDMDSNEEDGDRMGDLFHRLHIQGFVTRPKRAKFGASSSRATPKDVCPHLEKINDHFYQVCGPQAGRRPSVELIFFHGLQLEGSHKAHLTTWLSGNNSELWLTWILQDIPDARILTVSYDAHTKKTSKEGRMDIYVIVENLVQCLTHGEARVGQDGCPVVMVGHSIGGLVMKQLCVHIAEQLGLRPNKPTQTFLNNIKGLFFYASPNHGMRLADMSEKKGALFEDVTTLNTKASRQRAHFRMLCQNKGWRTYGIIEGHEVTLGPFKGLVVPEASARSDVEEHYYTVEADHFNVCRPQSRISCSFSLLLDFITGVVEQNSTVVIQVAEEASIRCDVDTMDHCNRGHFGVCKPADQKDSSFRKPTERIDLVMACGPAAQSEDRLETECDPLVSTILSSIPNPDGGGGVYLKISDFDNIRRFPESNRRLMDGLKEAGLERTGVSGGRELWEFMR